MACSGQSGINLWAAPHVYWHVFIPPNVRFRCLAYLFELCRLPSFSMMSEWSGEESNLLVSRCVNGTPGILVAARTQFQVQVLPDSLGCSQ